MLLKKQLPEGWSLLEKLPTKGSNHKVRLKHVCQHTVTVWYSDMYRRKLRCAICNPPEAGIPGDFDLGTHQPFAVLLGDTFEIYWQKQVPEPLPYGARVFRFRGPWMATEALPKTPKVAEAVQGPAGALRPAEDEGRPKPLRTPFLVVPTRFIPTFLGSEFDEAATAFMMKHVSIPDDFDGELEATPGETWMHEGLPFAFLYFSEGLEITPSNIGGINA